MVFSIPFSTSTMPLILLMSSATFGAQSSSVFGSCENNLTWMSTGSLVRSPIMSCNTCMNSTLTAGSWAAIFARTSAMISSMPRLRSRFNFTKMSPRFASVTVASPNSSPVRREVLSTSGTSFRIFSICRTMRLVSDKDDPAGVQ